MRLSSTFLFSLVAAGCQLPTLDGQMDDGMNITDADMMNGTTVTMPPEPNDCDKIEIGSAFFIFLNSVDPDEVVIFLLEDFPGELDLYLTDNAWNGIEFQTDEGILKYTTPTAGLPGGTFFGFGPGVPKGTEWKAIDGSFSLTPEGEQVFLYCYSADGFERPLTALSYNGPFQLPGLENYLFNESALPTELLDEEGAIILPTEEHWNYAGPSGVTPEELREFIKDPSQWKGGDGRAEFSTSGTTGVPTTSGICVAMGVLWSMLLWSL